MNPLELHAMKREHREESKPTIRIKVKLSEETHAVSYKELAGGTAAKKVSTIASPNASEDEGLEDENDLGIQKDSFLGQLAEKYAVSNALLISFSLSDAL